MIITRKEIQDHLNVLLTEKEQVEARLNQDLADLNAIGGAIQECEIWIKKIDREEELLIRKLNNIQMAGVDEQYHVQPANFPIKIIGEEK